MGFWLQPLLGLGASSGPFLGFWTFSQLFLGLRTSSGPFFLAFSGPQGFFWAFLWASGPSQPRGLFWAFCLFPAFSGSLFWPRRLLGLFPAFSGLGGVLWASGPLASLFWPFLYLLWASGPLPSLFWPSGPFVGLCGLLRLFPAFSGLGAFLPFSGLEAFSRPTSRFSNEFAKRL